MNEKKEQAIIIIKSIKHTLDIRHTHSIKLYLISLNIQINAFIHVCECLLAAAAAFCQTFIWCALITIILFHDVFLHTRSTRREQQKQ